MKNPIQAPKQTKRLSQVFLNTSWPCEEVSQTLLKQDVSSVLEIGPGEGILTENLLSHGFKVSSIEKDGRFANFLGKKFQKNIDEGHLTITNDDILLYDFSSWHVAASNAAICGNIPYNISSDIMHWLLPKLPTIKLAVFLVQLEFAERLASSPSQKSYGSLSVFTQLRANVSLLAKVPRTDFNPPPKVDSALIAFYPRQQTEESEVLSKVEELTKLAFSQRRKKISNALKEPFSQLAGKHNFDLSRRPENLSPAEYVTLAKMLLNKPL